ncbi:MAG: hypothetical protein IJ733_05715 [Lachnospiraceae bacterium]|nr:hypothetical protein [Lachnospiraceae bacterium]
MIYPFLANKTDGKKTHSKILGELEEQSKILTVSLEELHDKAELFLEKKSGFLKMDTETIEEHQVVALYIYEMFFENAVLRILLQPFSGKCVMRDGLHFGKEYFIACPILEHLELEAADVISGYLYTFHAPEPAGDIEKLSLLEKYYLENWLVSFLDAGREHARAYLFRKHNVRETSFVTDSFGPGFYGMSIEAVRQIFEVLDGSPVGVSLMENGNMSPLKSCVGMYLVLKKDVSHLMGQDCTNCAGSKHGCYACRNI